MINFLLERKKEQLSIHADKYSHTHTHRTTTTTTINAYPQLLPTYI